MILQHVSVHMLDRLLIEKPKLHQVSSYRWLIKPISTCYPYVTLLLEAQTLIPTFSCTCSDGTRQNRSQNLPSDPERLSGVFKDEICTLLITWQ